MGIPRMSPMTDHGALRRQAAAHSRSSTTLRPFCVEQRVLCAVHRLPIPMSTEYQYAQGFGAFQATPAPYPTYTGQPQVQYAGQVPPTTSYAMHPAGQPNPPTSPHEPAPAPDIPAVTSGIASAVMQRLLLSELLEVGFDSVSPLVLHRFENEVTACSYCDFHLSPTFPTETRPSTVLNDIFTDAHDYANYATRANPMAVDLLRATQDHGLEPKDLYRMGQLTKKRRQSESFSPHNDGLPSNWFANADNPEMGTTVLVPPPSRSPSPELLPSDDEGTTPVVPVTLRTLPQNFHLPALPPKHTYLRTPVSV